VDGRLSGAGSVIKTIKPVFDKAIADAVAAARAEFDTEKDDALEEERKAAEAAQADAVAAAQSDARAAAASELEKAQKAADEWKDKYEESEATG
jgi:hypothetical protein